MKHISKFGREFNSKDILILFVGALVLAAILSFFLSKALTNRVVSKIRDREIGLLIGALQSGPLGFARLHSSEIAQEQLDRIMNNPSVLNRGIIDVRLKGGKDQEYTYAEWRDNNTHDGKCVVEKRSISTFPNSLHDFLTIVSIDSCMILPEERSIFGITSIVLLGALSFVIFILGLIIFPVISSFKKTQTLIQSKVSDANVIPFIPLRELAVLAKKGVLAEREYALNKLAAQVAHDIRSPLGALEILLSDQVEINSSNKNVLKNSVVRIRDIINSLNANQERLPQAVPSAVQLSFVHSEKSYQLVHHLLDVVVAEKDFINSVSRSIEIEVSLTNDFRLAFIEVDSSELKRVFSNILDNSIHAMNASGRISISGKVESEAIIVDFVDEGGGIPPEVLERIGERGVTFGKVGGSGLGVYHARAFIESCGGRIEFKSKVKKGTTVRIVLPMSSPPSCFVTKLVFTGTRRIVIVDDDLNIHELLKKRLSAIAAGIPVASVHSPAELRSCFNSIFEEIENTMFIVDYEYADTSETGIDLIRQLGISERSVLNTNRFDSVEVQQLAEKVGCKILPKPLMHIVPIYYETEEESLL